MCWRTCCRLFSCNLQTERAEIMFSISSALLLLIPLWGLFQRSPANPLWQPGDRCTRRHGDAVATETDVQAGWGGGSLGRVGCPEADEACVWVGVGGHSGGATGLSVYLEEPSGQRWRFSASLDLLPQLPELNVFHSFHHQHSTGVHCTGGEP